MKIAYITLIVAASLVCSRMVIDLSGEDRLVSPGAPHSVRTRVSSSYERYESDKNVEKRINEILQSDDEQPAPLLSEDTSPEQQLEETNTLKPSVPVAETVVSDTVATVESSAGSIRQQTPLHAHMLTPGNFVYLGGFRPEFGEEGASRFGLGGCAIAYRPGGDPNGGIDGHPGSLFLLGHRHDQLVAEISIPKPVVSLKRDIDELPVAEILQPFADITSGLRTRMTGQSSEPFEIGGMHVVGNRLHWTIYKYYNVTGIDHPSHGLSSVNLSNRAVRGLWHLGPQGSGDPRWHSYKHAGYICDIPVTAAHRYFGRRNLMSGLQISSGRQTSSQGPALFAYGVSDENLPSGSSLSAVPLLWYPMDDPVNQHHPADSWQGAAWLTLGNKQAVIVVGRKALGPVHYGLPRPGECYDYKGYHGSSYEAQMLFYTPEQLLAASKKNVASTQPSYRWDANTPGGGLDRFMYQKCRKEIGGITLDRERNLLYIAEVEAALSKVNEWEKLPVIHVFKIVQ